MLSVNPPLPSSGTPPGARISRNPFSLALRVLITEKEIKRVGRVKCSTGQTTSTGHAQIAVVFLRSLEGGRPKLRRPGAAVWAGALRSLWGGGPQFGPRRAAVWAAPPPNCVGLPTNCGAPSRTALALLPSCAGLTAVRGCRARSSGRGACSCADSHAVAAAVGWRRRRTAILPH